MITHEEIRNYDNERKLLNKYRNSHYNDIDKEKIEVAIALNVVLPYISILEFQLEKKDIIVKENLINFITNVIVEADEFGLEPTIPCNEDGKDITKRWSSRLKEIIALWEELS